jgi:Fatty acid desaturase
MRGPVKGYLQSTEIRQSYNILPLQGVWTWLTGKELLDRKALWQSSSTEMVFWSLSWVVIGVALTTLSVEFVEALPLQILCWVVGALFATSGARYIVATIIHHGVHGHLYKSQKVNKTLCEILSTIFIVQPYESYRQFHVYEHHGREFSTFDDKDLAAIYQLGFTPGKSKSALYARLALTLISPKFHLVFFYGRVKSNLVGVPFYRLLMSLVWFATLSAISYFSGFIVTMLVLVLPFVVLYQMASLIHLLTEHVWLVRKEGESVRDSHINNCLARFCGSKCPPNFALKQWGHWTKWAAMHLFLHLPCRMLFVQGSLVCHDWHHRYGSVRQWYDYARLREIHASKLSAEGRYDYIDIWGVHNALDYVLSSLSNEAEVEIENLEYRLN